MIAGCNGLQDLSANQHEETKLQMIQRYIYQLPVNCSDWQTNKRIWFRYIFFKRNFLSYNHHILNILVITHNSLHQTNVSFSSAELLSMS